MVSKESSYLDRRPLNVRARWGSEDVALVSGRDVFGAMKHKGAIALAANARHPLTVKGILKAAKKLDAAVVIEIAKSETNYCGSNFDSLPEAAVRYSSEIGHGAVFALHVDHYGIKGYDDVIKAVSDLGRIVKNGWTSVAIDASHLPDWENLCATRDVAMHVPPYFGLEVEVGEIKGAGELSTVEEALYFVGGLNSWSVFPDLLAISNGSLHGTYDASKGQSEGIDLERTREIAEAIAPYGVSIAQHGISGTAIDKCAEFSKYGINKGNVATLFQNVLFGIKMDQETGNAVIEGDSYVKEPDRGIPMDLWNDLVSWCDGQGYSRKDGNYKKANLPFWERIASLPSERLDMIVEETQWWAERFIKAFNAEGTAEIVKERMSSRENWNPFPDTKVQASRGDFGADKAPNAAKKDGEDYSD
ncbi:MAG: class II fructose-bisphosphate aldolase [Synergistota bacterium]|nr:class II fructose-bisphosphate aldolase [Synergistota bacterium]